MLLFLSFLSYLCLNPLHLSLFSFLLTISYMSWGPAISASTPSLPTHRSRGGTTPHEAEGSSHGTIPEISLSLHLKFHLPWRDGGVGQGFCAIGWREGEEKQRKTAVVQISDFPCLSGGGVPWQLHVCKPCVCGNANKTHKCYLLVKFLTAFTMDHIYKNRDWKGIFFALSLMIIRLKTIKQTGDNLSSAKWSFGEVP